MPVSQVVLVHGYSARTLSSYGRFPALLTSAGIPTIRMSAFQSLDDQITCDDLADALEDRISGLVPDPTMVSTAFVCHSTGAIVVRRWILNRLEAGKQLPSHLVTLAGAHHGSTLAQLGRTIIAYLFREIIEHSDVGQLVLRDLDYGSDFLRRLNREWMTNANAVGSPLANMFCFSMGGDTIGDWIREIIWQSKEPGSDSTVRISGANLNYTWLTFSQRSAEPIAVNQFNRRYAHLILHGYSHTGTLGIIDAVGSASDAPFSALKQALNVQTEAEYDALTTEWAGRSNAWTNDPAQADNVNATLVFHLTDYANNGVDDSLILLQDGNRQASTLSNAILGHQPIQNEAVNSSVSFYINYPKFQALAPHTVSIQARSDSPLVDYEDVTYVVPSGVLNLVSPNEFTYVDVALDRNVAPSFSLLEYPTNRGPNEPWPPMPAST